MASRAPIWYNKCEYLRIQQLSETSNYFTALADIYRGGKLTLQCYNEQVANSSDMTTSVLTELYRDALFNIKVTNLEMAILIALTVLWTLLRTFLVHFVFFPYAKYIGVLEKNTKKFGESAWKVVAYGIMWSTACYVTFFRGHDFFFNTVQMWKASSSSTDNDDLDLKWTYAIEASFYLHSIYSTIYMDIWRKDSRVMLAHHVVTLWLIATSYAVGVRKIGVLIFVLDDVSDVVLEFGKVLMYVRHRNSGYSPAISIASDVVSAIFALQWLVLYSLPIQGVNFHLSLFPGLYFVCFIT